MISSCATFEMNESENLPSKKQKKRYEKEILNTRRETIIVVRSGSESFQVSSPLFWIAVISVNARGPRQDPGTYPPGSYWILCSTGALTNKKANQNKNKTYNNQQTKARYFLLKSKEVRAQNFWVTQPKKPRKKPKPKKKVK